MLADKSRLRTYPSSLRQGLSLLIVIFVEHAIVGGNHPITGLAFSIAYAAAILWMMAARFDRDVRAQPPFAAACLFGICLVQCVTMPLFGRAVDPTAALQETVKLGGLACLFLAGVLYSDFTEQLQRWIVRLGLVYLLLFLTLHFIFPDTVLGVEKFTAKGRFTGSFVSANTAASLSAILLIFASASLIRIQRIAVEGSPLWWRQFSDLLQHGLAELLMVIMASGALVLTASRAGIALGLCCVVGLMLWQAVADRQARKALSPLLIVGTPLLAALAIGGGALFQRLGSTVEAAGLRGDVFQVHWGAFLEEPVFGHGLGSFTLLNRQATAPDDFELLSTVRAAHNVYLQWLEQAGVVGSGLMFGSLVLVLVPIAIAAISKSHSTVELRATILVSLLLLGHGLFDYALEVPSIAAFWAFILGLAWGAARVLQHDGAAFAATDTVGSSGYGGRA